jgi:hypothetical protein
MKAALRTIATISIKAMTGSMNNKLVGEHLINRFVLIELVDAILCCNSTGGLDFG